MFGPWHTMRTDQGSMIPRKSYSDCSFIPQLNNIKTTNSLLQSILFWGVGVCQGGGEAITTLLMSSMDKNCKMHSPEVMDKHS